jgi:hypothetical protein
VEDEMTAYLTKEQELEARIERLEATVNKSNFSEGLEARIARAIFTAMKPDHITMADWDKGAILGENNSLRMRIEMAARLSVIEMRSL